MKKERNTYKYLNKYILNNIISNIIIIKIDNFITHPLARQIHHEAQDLITAKYPYVDPSPFTKLVNLHYMDGINISNFIDIDDDRQSSFLKKISKYTDNFILRKLEAIASKHYNKMHGNKDEDLINSGVSLLYAFGEENLSRADRQLKQRLGRKQQMEKLVEDYEKKIRKLLRKFCKELIKQNQIVQKAKSIELEKEASNLNDTLEEKQIDAPAPNSTKNSTEDKEEDIKKIKNSNLPTTTEQSSAQLLKNLKQHLSQYQLLAVWKVDNEFHRLVIHTLCRWYGLKSFSQNLKIKGLTKKNNNEEENKDNKKDNNNEVNSISARYTFIKLNTNVFEENGTKELDMNENTFIKDEKLLEAIINSIKERLTNKLKDFIYNE